MILAHLDLFQHALHVVVENKNLDAINPFLEPSGLYVRKAPTNNVAKLCILYWCLNLNLDHSFLTDELILRFDAIIKLVTINEVAAK